MALPQREPIYWADPQPVENTRGFLTFLTEIGLVDEFRLCVQRWLTSFKRTWYCTTIIWKHYGSVFSGLKQDSSNFDDVCHTRRTLTVSENYMTWTYPLHFLHFMSYSHTYSTVHNASKRRYMCTYTYIYTTFSSKDGFLLGICHILNLMTAIVLEKRILKLNTFFSLDQVFFL